MSSLEHKTLGALHGISYVFQCCTVKDCMGARLLYKSIKGWQCYTCTAVLFRVQWLTATTLCCIQLRTGSDIKSTSHTVASLGTLASWNILKHYDANLGEDWSTYTKQYCTHPNIIAVSCSTLYACIQPSLASQSQRVPQKLMHMAWQLNIHISTLSFIRRNLTKWAEQGRQQWPASIILQLCLKQRVNNMWIPYMVHDIRSIYT